MNRVLYFQLRRLAGVEKAGTGTFIVLKLFLCFADFLAFYVFLD